MRRSIAIAVVGLVVATGCSLPGTKTGPLTITATFTDIGDILDCKFRYTKVEAGKFRLVKIV